MHHNSIEAVSDARVVGVEHIGREVENPGELHASVHLAHSPRGSVKSEALEVEVEDHGWPVKHHLFAGRRGCLALAACVFLNGVRGNEVFQGVVESRNGVDIETQAGTGLIRGGDGVACVAAHAGYELAAENSVDPSYFSFLLFQLAKDMRAKRAIG